MENVPWKNRLDWVERNSPLAGAALSELKPDKELFLTVRFHLDLKMIPVIEGLAQRFSLLVFPCHQDTTDPEGWRYLKEFSQSILLPQWNPQKAREFLAGRKAMLCDLGGEMIAWAIEERIPIEAALEGTTSGLSRIRQSIRKNTLNFPVLDWNEAQLKREIHNEKMVGFSIWQTFTEVTRLSLHGKSVGILGFGPVGRGLARMARALGGSVSVFDPNTNARTIAKFEGFHCPQREGLLNSSEIIVTATGVEGVLKLEDLQRLPPGAIILNAGHSEKEICAGIRDFPERLAILAHLEELPLSESHSVFLLARGRLLNLSAGEGDTINGFDVTLAVLLRALKFLLDENQTLRPGLQVFEG